MQKIVPNLWFDTEAEDAARYYTSVFPNSKITDVSYFGEAGPREAGTVLTASFEIEGLGFTAINGGPDFKFNEAVSFLVNCESQEEVDKYWDRLIGDGGQESVCGWLKDKYGVSWQIIPTVLQEMIQDPDKEKANAVMKAMLQMKKIDVAELQKAYDNPRAA